jgi:hypothetical protein
MKSVVGIAVVSIFILALASIGLQWRSRLGQTGLAQTVPGLGKSNAPEIVSDTWLNSPPLASAALRGKVVVVEFWTFG